MLAGWDLTLWRFRGLGLSADVVNFRNGCKSPGIWKRLQASPLNDGWMKGRVCNTEGGGLRPTAGGSYIFLMSLVQFRIILLIQLWCGACWS